MTTIVFGLLDLMTSPVCNFSVLLICSRACAALVSLIAHSHKVMFFGLQETRDSLKQAFESLFEKYGKEFDDDDEIDILSLKVVKKSNTRSKEVQKPRKFGYLYQKEGKIYLRGSSFY